MRGEPAVGLDRLDRVRRDFRKWLGPSAVARRLLESVEIELRMALGESAVVLRTVDALDSGGHPLVRGGLAKAALLAGDAEWAVAYASDLFGGRELGPRIRLEAMVVMAGAGFQSGDLDGARGWWQRALALSDATGLIRPLLLLPRGTRAELTPAGRPPVEAALEAWGDGPFPPPVRAVVLTERELHLLEAMERSVSVAEIAESLYVSPNTVKTQARTLYRKLGVHSRADAVRVAKQRGLI